MPRVATSWRLAGNIASTEIDPTRSGRQHAGDEIEDGRLAGAIRSDESSDLVFAQDKIDAVDGVDAAEVLRQILNTDDVRISRDRPGGDAAERPVLSTVTSVPTGIGVATFPFAAINSGVFGILICDGSVRPVSLRHSAPKPMPSGSSPSGRYIINRISARP